MEATPFIEQAEAQQPPRFRDYLRKVAAPALAAYGVLLGVAASEKGAKWLVEGYHPVILVGGAVLEVTGAALGAVMLDGGMDAALQPAATQRLPQSPEHQ